MSPSEQSYLKRICSDPKHTAAFNGPHKLYQAVKKKDKYKIRWNKIRKFLSGIDAHSLQKKVQQIFECRKIIAEGIDNQ